MRRTNPETILALPIVEAANGYPGTHLVRVHSGSWPTRGGYMQGAPKGTTDYMGVAPWHCDCGRLYGRATAMETKTPEGALNDDQERFRHDWQRRGGLWILARKASDFVDAVHQLAVSK